MNKPLKPIPKFASEAEERAFWETPDNDSTAYLDWPRRQRKQISAQPKPYRVNPAPGKPPKLSTPYSPKRHLQLDRRLPHRSWCGSAVGRSFSSKYAFPV